MEKNGLLSVVSQINNEGLFRVLIDVGCTALFTGRTR
jgi:hypothetical protein